MEEAYENIHMMKNKEEGDSKRDDMMIQEGENSESSTSTSTCSSSMAASASSSCCSSTTTTTTDSEETEEDASSRCEKGPLFQLKDLMNELPNGMRSRRGLSKHYKGKSQSFTSLAHVKNLEDLAKKVSPYGKVSPRMMMIKSCKSYAVFADATHPTITSYK